MLQRSSLPSTSTAEIADSLGRSLAEHTWAGGRWRTLQDFLPLPATWQQYLLACLALTVVLGGLLLHVLLSVQIARADFQLRQMRETYARIERQNSELVYQIAQQSSLAHMAQLAAEQGYAPATERTYTVRSSAAYGEPVSGAQQAVNRSQAATPTAQADQRQSSTANATAPTWLEQIELWWRDASSAGGAATSQLWRDLTGRME